MNRYRKCSWLIALVMLVGSMMAPLVASGAEALPSKVNEYGLQDCGIFDTNCDDDEGAPRFEYEPSYGNDSCTGYLCDDDDEGAPRFEYEPSYGDDTCTGYLCDDDDEGAPRFEYELPDSDRCSGTGYVPTQIRTVDAAVEELGCEDDPWNGTTDGCSSWGSCNDDSFLVECSYVTASSFGSAEGACDVPLGQHQLKNCHPVSGPSNRMVYDTDPEKQTFRCLENGAESGGGYSIDDLDPMMDADVVLILCSPESGSSLGPDAEDCEGAPRGVNYYTCEADDRFIAPIGSDGDWYLCAK